MTESEIVEGQPRDPGPRHDATGSRYGFAGKDGGAPRLQFGEHGELTPRTIEQAGLTGEERKRAFEMLKLQATYLEIYNSLDYPNDPDGHVVDLSGVHMTQPKVAIAWTLTLLGYRSSGKKFIKKRAFSAPGVPANAYTWVDINAPDDAAQELRPEHRSNDHRLPPDTRRLAAMRDGDPGQQLRPPWSVAPKFTEEWECRICGRSLEPGESCPRCASGEG